MDSHWTVTVLQCGATLALLALLFRVRFPAILGWILVACSVFIIGALTIKAGARGIDARHFWTAGSHVWQGIDPYRSEAFMNPPTALPLYSLFALISFDDFSKLWKVINIASALVLICLSGSLIERQSRPSALVVGLIGAFMLLSFPYRYGIALGQSSLFTTLIVYLAVWCHQRFKPVAAGGFMALASMKPATMLPMLLLFGRWRDWKAWVSMIVVGFGLTFLAVAPGDLKQRLSSCLANIQKAGEAGAVNDYSFESRNNRELVAFDYAIYHLGLRDRGQVKIAQLLAVGLLGAWVAWQVMGRSRLSPGAACALVCCYATLFLYPAFLTRIRNRLASGASSDCSRSHLRFLEGASRS